MLDGILIFEGKRVENMVNCSHVLFIGAMKDNHFACGSCSKG
jgi:hypothetical protein